jgi:Flp pilus assembly pilin Flp
MLPGPEIADASGMPSCGRSDRTHFSCREEEAQTMAEYAVILGIITPIVILAFASLSGAVLSALNNTLSFL